MNKNLLFLFLFLSITTLQSQNFWFSDTIRLESSVGDLYRTPRIGTYEIGVCKEDSIETGLVPIPFSGHSIQFVGLTSHQSDDDILYGYGYRIFGGIPTTQKGLFWIHTNNCAVIHLDIATDSIFAMTSGLDELLYLAGNGLTTFDIITETFNYIGDLPPEMRAEGGLTLRGDKLLLSTISHTLVELDIEDPMNSTVIMNFPPNAPPIEALFSVNVTCDSTITYALGTSELEQKLYQIDFENETLIELCDMVGHTFGAAYPEWEYPECQLYVDLDENDSSGAGENDFFADTVCLPPINITDTDVEVFSDIEIDSISVELIDILNTGEEYLSLSGVGGLIFMGSNSTHISLINNGNTSNWSFENALKNIQYINDATNITAGERNVRVTIYSPGYISEPSFTTILIDGSLVLDVTADITMPDCFGEENGAILLETNNGTAPYDYQWLEGEIGNTLTDLAEGFYYFTVTDAGGCETIDSVFVAQPDSLQALITNAGATIVCDDSGILMVEGIGGTPLYSFLWEDGSTENPHTNLTEGTYFVTITDANDCTSTSSFDLLSDTIFVNQSEILCEGDSFIFGNEIFTTDTSFCVNLTAFNECDSIHCVELQFLDTVLVEHFEDICAGEFFEFGGVQYANDTSFCHTFPLINGCDSTVCLTLEVLGDLTNLSDEFCEGDIYDFNGLLISEGGIYFDTLINIDGCDSVLILDLQEIAIPIINFEQDGSLCNQEFITLSGGIHSSYQWSTNEIDEQILVNSDGEYSLTVSNSEGCTTNNSITIEEGSIGTVFFTLESPSCFGASDGWIQIVGTMNGVEPYLYSTDGGVTFQQNGLFENLSAGNTMITVEDVEGCQRTVDISLQDPSQLIVELGDNQTLKLGETISLTPNTNVINPTILWSPSDYLNCDTCLQTIAKPEQSIQYQVIITDEQGCTETDFINIIIDERTGIFVPNVFSPNNDGFNDLFTAYADESIETILSFQVFNRWGALVFQATDIDPNMPVLGWNGEFQGELAEAGVYIYSIEILRVDGVKELAKGDVLLVR